MKIENATIEDVPTLVGLAKVMAIESPNYSRFDFDSDKVFDSLCGLIENADGIVLVARTDEGELVGVFVGGITVMWFCTTTKVMTDFGFFLHPKHRGGGTAASLLQEAFRQGKEKGAAQAQITNTTGVYSEHVERLYQHVGMERIGGYYKLDL